MLVVIWFTDLALSRARVYPKKKKRGPRPGTAGFFCPLERAVLVFFFSNKTLIRPAQAPGPAAQAAPGQAVSVSYA